MSDSDLAVEWTANASPKRSPATLVVVPSHLLQQWWSEINKHIDFEQQLSSCDSVTGNDATVGAAVSVGGVGAVGEGDQNCAPLRTFSAVNIADRNLEHYIASCADVRWPGSSEWGLEHLDDLEVMHPEGVVEVRLKWASNCSSSNHGGSSGSGSGGCEGRVYRGRVLASCIPKHSIPRSLDEVHPMHQSRYSYCDGRLVRCIKEVHLRLDIHDLLCAHDIVLTNYHAIQPSHAHRAKTSITSTTSSGNGKCHTSRLLQKVVWHRIVLDECQEIKVATTGIAAMCAKLSSLRRWMVSGTPLCSKLEDLHGELNFLRVWPFCLSNKMDGFWQHKIEGPFQARDPACLELLDALLEAVMMRHSKSQCYLRDGSPLVPMPAR